MNESKFLLARAPRLGLDHRVAQAGRVETTQSGAQARRLLGMVDPRVVPVQLRLCSEYEHADNRRGKSGRSMTSPPEVDLSA
jgi:hypothetical protein